MVDRPFESASRRAFLTQTGILAASLAAPAWGYEASGTYVSDFWRRPRELNLVHASGERLKLVYWSDGQYLQHVRAELNWFMRDRVENRTTQMHPVLLDILYGVCGWLSYFGIRDPLELTSAYRTYNRNLRIEGAAQDSEHPKGGAGDIRHRMVSATQMSQFGTWLGGGGVGWYPRKNFTHVDRGRLRKWQG